MEASLELVTWPVDVCLSHVIEPASPLSCSVTALPLAVSAGAGPAPDSQSHLFSVPPTWVSWMVAFLVHPLSRYWPLKTCPARSVFAQWPYSPARAPEASSAHDRAAAAKARPAVLIALIPAPDLALFRRLTLNPPAGTGAASHGPTGVSIASRAPPGASRAPPGPRPGARPRRERS